MRRRIERGRNGRVGYLRDAELPEHRSAEEGRRVGEVEGDVEVVPVLDDETPRARGPWGEGRDDVVVLADEFVGLRTAACHDQGRQALRQVTDRAEALDGRGVEAQGFVSRRCAVGAPGRRPR